MAFAVDEHPFGALGPGCAYPSPGVAICPRCPWRDLHCLQALAGGDAVEGGRELGVAVPDDEAECPGSVAWVHDQVAGLLGGPGATGMGSHAQDVPVPGCHFPSEQHARRRRKIVPAWKKPQASSPFAGARRNARQEVSCLPGAGWPMERRIRRTVAALIRWPGRDSSPCTRRYPQDGFSRASRSTRSRISLAGPQAAGQARARPLAPDQAAVPGQQRARRDHAMAPQPGGQQPGQCGQDRPAGPAEPGPGDLTAQDREFMAQDQDLGVLRRLAAAEQLQPAKDPDNGEVQEPDRHSPRSCFIAVSRPNCRSQPLRRVLEQSRA